MLYQLTLVFPIQDVACSRVTMLFSYIKYDIIDISTYADSSWNLLFMDIGFVVSTVQHLAFA